MAKQSTAPKPAFLRAVQNQQWTVSGALSELVDNSFGTGRGNATEVRLAWYVKNRILTVCDNGQGMDDLTRLFQLGNTIGRGVGDIGEYGSGGTMALIWLGRHVYVWTLKKGRVAFANVDWNKYIQANVFPSIDPSWHRATEENTPANLFAQGQGTFIALALPHKRRVIPNSITTDLATTYSPALRQGRTVIWQSIPQMTAFSASGQEDPTIRIDERILGEPLTIPDAIELRVEFELDGQRLTAQGKAGYIDGLPISQSSMAIGFGPRLLLRTKDCYHGDKQTYNGSGVTGYVDLDDGWQPFLSTTKAVVDDNRAWEELMAQLFRQLEPLLSEAQSQAYSIFFDGIQLDLQRMLDGLMDVSLTAPDETGTQPGTGLHGGNGVGGKPGKRPPPALPPPARAYGKLRLNLVPQSDPQMEGLLCQIDVQNHSLAGSVNKDHSFVQAAMAERPPNRLAFHHMVVTSIVDAILQQRPELLDEIFNPATRRRLQALKGDPQMLRGLFVRVLLDSVTA